MFIDGEWCDAADGATVEATSPATGESLGQLAEGSREDARRAIAAANAAFHAWASRTGFERGALLHRVADACERRRQDLARICALDQGKPLKAEAEVGDELAANPGTHAVAFTGSTQTGMIVSRRAAGKAQLLEMGGNGPFVVMDDADLDAAAQAAQIGCFLGAGQSCSAAERLLVHEAVREEFVTRAPADVKRDIRLGDPLEEATTLGPLNNEPGAAKMDEHVADAVERGAEVVAGGARAEGFPTRLYWPATVLDRVPADSIAVTQETFGPIAPIVSIGSLEEAIEQTNAQSYGLMAAIFTGDLASGLRYADSVHMGLVNINETTNYWEAHLPWGGRGRSESGIGRVGGRYPMDTLTELQTVMIRSGPPQAGAAP